MRAMVVPFVSWLLLVLSVESCSAPPPPRTASGSSDVPRTDAGADAGGSTPTPDAGGTDAATTEPAADAPDGPASTAVPGPGADDTVGPAVPSADAAAPRPADAAADAGRADGASDGRTVPDGSSVVHRVGCDPITRDQVDRELRLLAAWEGRAIDPAQVPDDDPLRVETLQVLVDQRIVEREARALGLRVEALELQQAEVVLAQRMGGEVAQVFGMFQQLGVEMADVEQALEAQVLAYKVALAIAERQGVHATDEQIAVEYATRTAGLDPSLVRPLEEAREGLRQELEFKLRIEAGRAWVIEQRAVVERLRTRTTGGRCVELPPAEAPPAS